MHQKKMFWPVVVTVLFFTVAGVWYLSGIRRQQEPVEVVQATVVPEEPFTESDGKDNNEPQAEEALNESEKEEEPGSMFVFLCGAVVNPGVFELPEGSRLFEALALAGGFLPEADTEYLNLAREVFDGERIYFPTKEESTRLSVEERITGETAVKDKGTVQDTEERTVDLNTATVAELMTLPGIGQSRAESIVEYRMKVGRFRETEEIMNISGIGEAMFERIKERITTE